MTRCYRIHARRRNCFEPPRTLVGRRTRTDRDGICPPPRDSPIDPSQKSRLGGSRSWDFLISSRALYQLSYRTKGFTAVHLIIVAAVHQSAADCGMSSCLGRCAAHPATDKSDHPLRWLVLISGCAILIGNYYCFDNPSALKTQLQHNAC